MTDFETSFNLASVWQVLQKRRVGIGWLVVGSVALCAATLFLLPRYYKSTAVVLPANPQLNDKANLYNQNIQQLYSVFGTTDDLDRLYGIANLDTTYKLLTDEFNLVQYYRSNQKNEQLNRANAALALKDDIELQRTDLNQLTVSCWNKNADTAAAIANSMVKHINEKTKQSVLNQYQQAAKNVDSSIAVQEIAFQKLSDSAAIGSKNSAMIAAKSTSLLQQISTHRQLSFQLQQAMQSMPPALVVVQAASPGAKPDRPKVLLTLMGAFFISLLFGIIVALVLNRKSILQ